MKKSSFYSFSIALWSLLVLFTVASCKENEKVEPAEPIGIEARDTANMWKAYYAGVTDAKDVQSSEVASNLLMISASNKDLVRDAEGRVLVASWKSQRSSTRLGFAANIGKEMEVPDMVWITVAPQLKNILKDHNLDSANLKVRVEQLLGLPPYGFSDRFIQLWVYPQDLFRPCPDSEISDNKCDTSFPANVSADYKVLFEDIKKSTWGTGNDPQGFMPYPWTSLGYTYDWGVKKGHIGASEFIVKKGAKVKVESITTTVAYFK